MASPKRVVTTEADTGPCLRCDELRHLHRYTHGIPSHCKECLSELADSSLLAWFDLFHKAVDPQELGGSCMGVAFAVLTEGCASKADFLLKASRAWEDTSPFVQALRERLN